MEPMLNHVYRHCSGKFYLFLMKAYPDKGLTESVYVYQELFGYHRVLSCKASEFTKEVKSGENNPTEQKHEFELVKDLEHSISADPTHLLVEELKSREGVDFDVSTLISNLWSVTYELGHLFPLSHLNEEGEEVVTDEFHPLITGATKEEVENYIRTHVLNESFVVLKTFRAVQKDF